MATLELAIDGRPMQAGAQQAQTALDQVTKAATSTVAAVDRVGTASASTSDAVARSARAAQQAADATRAAATSWTQYGDAARLVQRDGDSFERSATSVEGALRRTTLAAREASAATTGFGQNINKAFQATSGSLQVAGGIAATTRALSELNTAAAASTAGRLLLEIGKTANDFRELSGGITQSALQFDEFGLRVTGAATATSRLGSVFGTLGAVIKANPLLAAATAIGAIGAAMSLFSSQTKEAADAYRGFTEELSKSRISDEAADLLGVPRTGAQRRERALVQAAEFTRTGQPLTTGQFPGYEREVAEFLRRQGDDRQQRTAEEFLRTGSTTRAVPNISGTGGGGAPVMVARPGLPGDIQLTPDQSAALLRELYAANQRQVEADKAAATAAEDAAKARALIAAQLESYYEQMQGPVYGPEAPLPEGVVEFGQGTIPAPFPQQGMPGGPLRGSEYQYRDGRLLPQYQTTPGQAPYYLGAPEPTRPTPSDPGFVDMPGGYYEGGAIGPEPDYQLAAQMAEADRRSVEASQEVAANMQRAADFAGNLGATMGSAFADVLMKTTTLRQAFASIVSSFARQGLADVGAAVFRGITGGVAGVTPTQTQGNVGIQQPR